jgi:hypothetical protein
MANKLLVSTIFARDCLSRGLFVVPNLIKFLPKIELNAVPSDLVFVRNSHKNGLKRRRKGTVGGDKYSGY